MTTCQLVSCLLLIKLTPLVSKGRFEEVLQLAIRAGRVTDPPAASHGVDGAEGAA